MVVGSVEVDVKLLFVNGPCVATILSTLGSTLDIKLHKQSHNFTKLSKALGGTFSKRFLRHSSCRESRERTNVTARSASCYS